MNADADVARQPSSSLAPALESNTFPIQPGRNATGEFQSDDEQRPPTQLEEWLRLRTDVTLDDAEAMRREAITLFAIGRMHANDGELEAAARMLARAHRLDPDSAAILDQILPVVFQLNRPGQAMRYARIAVDVSPEPNPGVVQFLADEHAQQGEFAEALALYARFDELIPAGEKWTERYFRTKVVTGTLYQALEKYSEAVAEYEVVLSALDNPRNFRSTPEELRAALGDPQVVFESMAEAFLHAGEIDRAEELFDAAYSPENTPSAMTDDEARQAELSKQLHRAQVAHARGKSEEAMSLVDDLLAAPSAATTIQALELLENILAAAGREDDFVPRLRKLSVAHPAETVIAGVLATRLEDADELDEAADVLASHLSNLPEEGNRNRLARMTTIAGLIDLRAKQRDAAGLFASLAQFAQMSERPAPLDDVVLEALDDAEFARQMLAVIDGSVENDPLEYGGLISAASIAQQVKDYDRAADLFNAAIEAKRNLRGELLLYWGVNLLLDEENARAAEVFQRGISERALPFGEPDFYFHLAGVLAVMDEHEEAIRAARRAAAMASDNPRIIARLGWAQFLAGDEAAATNSYEAIIRRFDEDFSSPDIRDAVKGARFVLSTLAVDRGEVSEGEEWLEQVLDEFPDDAGAMNDLGYLWADQDKNLSRARAMIQHAVDEEPDNAAYLDSLGWVLHRLGRHAEAVPHLERSVELREEPDGVVLDHLGDAYLATDNIPSAVETWQKALEAFDPEEQTEMIKAVQAKLSEHDGDR